MQASFVHPSFILRSLAHSTGRMIAVKEQVNSTYSHISPLRFSFFLQLKYPSTRHKKSLRIGEGS